MSTDLVGVDVLFVVDNSGSMEEEQQILAASVFDLINALAGSPALALQVACLSNVGTEGCHIEQQLQASVVALTNAPDFVRPGRLLAVFVVSDEEDCSLAKPGLFTSPQWQRNENTACHMDVDRTLQDDCLCPTSRFVEALRALKPGEPKSVLFAAIVDVPPRTSDAPSPCEGRGDALAAAGCLDRPEMQLEKMLYESEYGYLYEFLRPACERLAVDASSVVMRAVSGRRFVKVAQEFGDMGFVFSIRNDNWTTPMVGIADRIAWRVADPG